MDCLPLLSDESLPFLEAGEEPLARDAGRSEREVRRLGGGSEENPGKFDCHPRNFGDAELPRLAFTGEAPLLAEEDMLPPDPVLILLSVGVEDLGVGVDGLFGGVDGLLDGVAGRKTGAGLA